EALDGSGNVTFQQLYLPYGGIRYTSGAAPTTRYYTGQRWDSAASLHYYVARYYDAIPHQFTGADTMQDGLNRFGYVHANPETYTDPTGHWYMVTRFWYSCGWIRYCILRGIDLSATTYTWESWHNASGWAFWFLSSVVFPLYGVPG